MIGILFLHIDYFVWLDELFQERPEDRGVFKVRFFTTSDRPHESKRYIYVRWLAIPCLIWLSKIRISFVMWPSIVSVAWEPRFSFRGFKIEYWSLSKSHDYYYQGVYTKPTSKVSFISISTSCQLRLTRRFQPPCAAGGLSTGIWMSQLPNTVSVTCTPLPPIYIASISL